MACSQSTNTSTGPTMIIGTAAKSSTIPAIVSTIRHWRVSTNQSTAKRLSGGLNVATASAAPARSGRS
jgi:hypothetical protein